MRFKPVRFEKIEPDKMMGAGDLVARLAKPVARTIDRVLGTRLAECQSCEERQQWLNRFHL